MSAAWSGVAGPSPEGRSLCHERASRRGGVWTGAQRREDVALSAVRASDPGGSSLVQPGIKCRGREYLRIIYGADYTAPEQLGRLRGRGLGRKRALASREHALGVAALNLVAEGAPLWRVHQLVFAILACESEPVDPRL